MTGILAVLVVLLGVFIISVVVFGGAQMFIPYFKILLVNILKIEQEQWDSVLSIANATPGIFGIKVAMASGYLAACGQWWGWLLMIASYLVFIIVPIIVMIFVMKKYNKMKESKFMITFLKLMRPMIAGILISIVVNLGMSIFVPFVGFNDLGDNFGSLEKYFYLKDTFFKNWRYWVLLVWSCISIPIDLLLIRKYKINVIYIILIQIILCLILFQPWL